MFASRKEVQKAILAAKEQIRSKRTVQDTKKFQTFLTKSFEKNSFGSALNKTARLDEDFASFLERYRQETGVQVHDVSHLGDSFETKGKLEKLKAQKTIKPDKGEEENTSSRAQADVYEEFNKQNEEIQKMDIREKIFEFEKDKQLDWKANGLPIECFLMGNNLFLNITCS